MKTRILACLLSVLMLVSLIPVSTFAAEADVVINSVATLKDFRDHVNAGDNMSGKKVLLLTDIDLGGETWTPIKSFAGEFDGGSHTISNFKLDATSSNAGFFAYVGQFPAKICNLTLSDVTATVGNHTYGTLSATVNTSTFTNINIKNVKVTTTTSGANVGGMLGYFNWNTSIDCKIEAVEVDASKGAQFIGGYAAWMDQDLEMNNVDVNGFKVTVVDTDGVCDVGGFTGQTQTGHRQPTMSQCDITGLDITASGTVKVGGFIGDAGAHTIVKNCTTGGKINASGITDSNYCVGGFFSDAGWNNNESNKGGHKLTNCTADVDIITNVAPAGGFIGGATNWNDRNMAIAFTNCAAKGAISVVEGGTAPVGGFAGEADRGVYTNCSASGVVTGHDYAGGFIGHILPSTTTYKITLNSCESISMVTGASGRTAGLIGYIDPNTDVTLTNNTYIVSPMFNPYDEALDNGNTQIPLYTVTVEKIGEGTVSGGATVIDGQSVTLTATPAAGYRFVGWKQGETNVSTAASYTFVPTADVTVVAVFELIPNYTIVVTTIGDGIVTGAGTYAEGTEVTLTAEPANGYNFVRWEEDGDELGTEPTLTVTVNSIHNITAVFEKPQTQPAFDYILFALAARYAQKYDVIVTAENATVTGDMAIKYKRNGTVDIAVADGYKVVDVIANGQSLGAVDSVTFKQVKAPQTLVVVTEKLYTNPYTDIADDNAAVQYVTENGLMTAAEEGLFAPEAEVTRTLLAEVLYALAGKPEVDATVTVNDAEDAAILWAAANGILTPNADGLVEPDTVITLADLNAALNAYAGTTDVVYVEFDAEAEVAATRADLANTIYLFCTIHAEG